MKQQEGNSVIIILIFVTILITVLMLIFGIVMGNVNAMVHTVKTDMYLINKSAVVAVNKNRANVDEFSYSTKEYEKFFKKSLMKNYHLNEDLENKEGFIQKVSIEEYTIYQPRQKDSYTGESVEGTLIHTLITVKMKPVLLPKQLESLFTFQVHEDVFLEMAKHE